MCSSHGRVVKATDSKSVGLCPRRFESCWLRDSVFISYCCGNTFKWTWLHLTHTHKDIAVRVESHANSCFIAFCCSYLFFFQTSNLRSFLRLRPKTKAEKGVGARLGVRVNQVLRRTNQSTWSVMTSSTASVKSTKRTASWFKYMCTKINIGCWKKIVFILSLVVRTMS